ncbi:MAG TPA: hypothetical protein VII11_08590, partial [Bacteroidota bacterium]
MPVINALSEDTNQPTTSSDWIRDLAMTEYPNTNWMPFRTSGSKKNLEAHDLTLHWLRHKFLLNGMLH